MPGNPFCLGRCDRPRHVSDAGETRGPAVGAVQTRRRMRELASCSGGCAWCGRSNPRPTKADADGWRRGVVASSARYVQGERAGFATNVESDTTMREKVLRGGRRVSMAGVESHGSGARAQSGGGEQEVGGTNAPSWRAGNHDLALDLPG